MKVKDFQYTTKLFSNKNRKEEVGTFEKMGFENALLIKQNIFLSFEIVYGVI